MNGETDLYGIFVPHLLICGLVALAMATATSWLVARMRLYRFFWHPPLVDLCIFVLCLSFVNAVSDWI